MKLDMKKCWIAAVCLGALVTACKDEEGAPGHATPPPAAEPAEARAAMPGEPDVRAQLLPALAGFPAVKLGEVQVEATPAEGGGELLLTARVQAVVEENLYTQEAAPEMLNEERKFANEAMNRAMMPEAHYLLQVGAATGIITEADRKPKPLPQELQAQADELKHAAESPVYHLHTTADTTVEMPATLRAHRAGGRWEFAEVSLDTAPLRSLVGTLPEGALPKDAAVVREGFEEQQRLALRKKVEAFNEAAKPYIEQREAAARQRALEAQAQREIEEKTAAEAAAAQAACREVFDKACAERLRNAAVFTGEWKRGESFGKLGLRLSQVQRMEDSMQFVGVLYDPDMPQAEIQVVGRGEAPAAPQEPVSVIVRLYHGRYDPDVATAEVYDAKDGLLRLKLAADGVLTGEMTCAAWGDAPEKAFAVSMAPTAPKSPAQQKAKK